MSAPKRPLLRVEDLRVEFSTEDGVVHAVDGITYEVQRGRTLGIVGESGSGKTVASLTTLGLTRAPGRARVAGGSCSRASDLRGALRGRAARDPRQRDRDDLPGPAVLAAPVLQGRRADRSRRSARTATSPRRRRARARSSCSGSSASPTRRARVDDYPHEFSGGMRQRAMIAMALANEPKLLIADEPTTALDVTVQAQILALLERLQRELGMAIVIITHDLGVVAEMADDIAVMYAGRIVETALRPSALRRPRAPLHVGAAALDPARSSGPREELLVPIPGTPPSLISAAVRLSLSSALPLLAARARAHRPALEPVPGEPGHHVACLLDSSATAAVGELRDGRMPDEARAAESAAGAQRADVARRAGEPLAARCAPRQALPDHARRRAPAQRRRGAGGRRRRASTCSAARRSGSSARPAAARARRRG